MSDWIKVEDTLPKILEGNYKSEDVLVVCESHGETNEFGYFNTYKKGEKYISVDAFLKWKDKEKPSFRGERYYGKVTHWMPIPEMPIEEETADIKTTEQ